MYKEKDFYLQVKKNLRNIQNSSGYSRAYVAEQIGITFQAYSDMLSLALVDRYPSLETIRRLCNFFEVEPICFFQEENKVIKSQATV